MKRSLKATWLVPAAALAMMGCPDEELAPLEPCTVSGVSNEITQSGTDQLDLLFVMDNSGSMEEEQAKIAEQVPRLVRILASGDFEGDGVLEFTPVKSLQLGVVSTNMGTQGAFTVGESCDGRGDDGKLLNVVGAGAPASCAGKEFDLYQTFQVPDDPNAVAGAANQAAADFGCVAALGKDGCGLEQQLEAMLKAVTPENSEDIEFVEGSGRGKGGSNGGFVRDDAVLAIIHVTDEEDCSVTKKGRSLFLQDYEDPYNGPDDKYSGQDAQLNFQCANASDSDDDDASLFQPTQRFIDGLKALKPANPERIIFAAIAGIPLAAEGNEYQDGDVQAFDKILAMEDMQTVPNDDDFPANPGAANANDRYPALAQLPRPACQDAVDTAQRASPARRFVEVAKGFGENGIVRSICAPDYESSLDVILEKISKQFQGACLPQPLNPDNQGIVSCDVVEILPVGASQDDCILSQGRRFKENRVIVGTDGKEQTHVVCDVNQVAVIDGKLTDAPSPLPDVNPRVGWYYDDFSDTVQTTCPEGQRRRIATTEGAEPSAGATFRFECFNPVGGDLNKAGQAAVGAACREDDQCKDDDTYSLFCEPVNNTCQIECEGDASCPDGWVCDDFGGEKSYCVNPKCPPASAG